MAFLAPGVDIIYPSNGPPLIRELSTSTTAFIGPTVVNRGPAEVKVGQTDAPIIANITEMGQFIERFATPGAMVDGVSLPKGSTNNAEDPMGHAVRGFFANGGSEAYIVSTSRGGSAAASNSFKITGLSGGDVEILVTAVSEGDWGNGIELVISRATAEEHVDIVITSTIGDGAGSTTDRVERFTAVPATEDALVAIASQYVIFTLDTATGPELDATDEDMSEPLQLKDGKNADGPNASTNIDKVIEALQDIDDVSLIVLTNVDWTPGGASNANYEKLISHCEKMADRAVIVTVDDDVTNFKANGARLPESSYLAAYYPSGRVTLPITATQTVTQTTGLGGHVAGVIARMDAREGPWQSPAGLSADVRAVTEFTIPLSRTQQGPMNDNGVNALRVVNGIQTVYGARTRHMGGIYQYLAIRRVAFLIGDSLRAAMQRVVFAKNVESTWQNVKTAVNGFMSSLYNRNAFQGGSAQEAFQVFCGLGESMTQTDIDNGKLIVRARFRGAKPAEFITISVEQMQQGEG